MIHLSNRITFFGVVILTIVMLVIALYTASKDSLTFDELAHIGAGYSYLTKQDYRINPEHPPLIKDLSAIPLVFLHLTFPEKSQNWLQEQSAPPWWVQFNLGSEFLYQSNNNPKEIIFWARIPMILLYITLGLCIFFWTRKLTSNTGGLLAFFLYALSPTLLAHGRLVTTDVGATLGAVFATYFWIQFLKNPSKKNIFIAGIIFGVAMCIKFTLVLLIPFFGILTILYALLLSSEHRGRCTFHYVLHALFAGIIGFFFVVWPVYEFHILHYPTDNQFRDTLADLSAGGLNAAEKTAVTMADISLLRPFGQYAHGLLMATQRVSFGNTTYFLGEISAKGTPFYFPILFFFKEPISLFILLTASLLGIAIYVKKEWKSFFKEHFAIVASILFITFYWLFAIKGNLNIGIRHMIPMYPFLFMVIAWGIFIISKQISRRITTMFRVCLCLILIWYAFSYAKTFPYYISYFNEFAGGTKNGYKIAVDSNYDWGQDFYRLLEFVEKKKIEKLHLDYFGGEDPAYWLGEKYIPYRPCREKLTECAPNPTGWFAVSLNQFQGGVATPQKGFDQQAGYYNWLNQYTPIDPAGTSILLFHIE